MEEYYLVERENMKGPFSLEKLIEMRLSDETLVWKRGIKDWIPLKDLSEYKQNFPPPIPKIDLDKINDKITTIHEENKEKEDLTKQEAPIETKVNSNFHYATFWQRFIAFFIDFSILFCTTSFFWALLRLPIPSNAKFFFSGRFYIFQTPYAYIIGWLYYSLFESSIFQATPGKAIMHLKVTDYKNKQISFGKASGRYLGRIISALMLCIGFIMIAFTKEKQGFHDIMAGTLVLRGNTIAIERRKISWGITIGAFILLVLTVFISANKRLIPKNRTFSSENKQTVSETNFNPTIKSFSYKNITFNYLSDWIVSKKEMQKNLAYQIVCTKKGIESNESFSLIYLNRDIAAKEMLQNIITEIKSEDAYLNLEIMPIVHNSYRTYNAVSADYNYDLLKKKHFGRAIAFNTNEKVIVLLEISSEKEKLNSEFKIIENSLKIN